MKPKILSKYSLIDDLKVQKSITTRFLRYFKSRSIIQVLCKYTFLKKVRGIYPAKSKVKNNISQKSQVKSHHSKFKIQKSQAVYPLFDYDLNGKKILLKYDIF